MYRIVVAEDDEEIRNILLHRLRTHGYKAIGAMDYEQVQHIVEREYISLILCDVLLSDSDGSELPTVFTGQSYDIPVLLFRAHFFPKYEDVRVARSPQNLLDYRDEETMFARLRKILQSKDIMEIECVTFRDVSIALREGYVQIGEHRFFLKKEELFILGKIIFFPNKIYTKMQLVEGILDESGAADEQLLEQYMKKIQEIIKYSEEVEIKYIHGLGYKAVKRKEQEDV